MTVRFWEVIVMKVSRHVAGAALAAAAVLASPTALTRAAGQTPAPVELGTINFPTSAKPAAQASFLIGTKALFNFEFDIAGDAFREAQKADPAFALGYWGEAMSFNHPLWAQQDLAAARRVLERLAPTAAARAAKAPAGKERELIESLDVLFGAGDKLARDIAYAGAMGKLHVKYPADDEIACLYALALLGTGRPGVSNTRIAMQAAAISQEIFQRNPKHPGAAHYIIHSFDDPDHAILSLTAARAYSKIAPSAAHALHMPSYISACGTTWWRRTSWPTRRPWIWRKPRSCHAVARISTRCRGFSTRTCNRGSSRTRRNASTRQKRWPTKTRLRTFAMATPR